MMHRNPGRVMLSCKMLQERCTRNRIFSHKKFESCIASSLTAWNFLFTNSSVCPRYSSAASFFLAIHLTIVALALDPFHPLHFLSNVSHSNANKTDLTSGTLAIE